MHKIVLKLTNTKRDLADELQTSTKEINKKDSDGRTPLSWAAEHNNEEAVSVLLKFGAEIGTRDNEGNTPLHQACSCKNGGPRVLDVLLAARADVTARNKFGQTPLNWATFCQNDPAFAERLLGRPGVDLYEHDDKGNSALDNAAFSSNEKMLSYIIDAGVKNNKNFPEDDTTEALMDCISTNNYGSLAILFEKATLCGLNLARCDKDGESCLYYFARRADVQTVNVFHEAIRTGSVEQPTGLDPASTGKNGLTVRDLLSLRGNREVQEAMAPVLAHLEEHCADAVSLHEEVIYLDAQEYLPQLEKGHWFRIRSWIQGSEDRGQGAGGGVTAGLISEKYENTDVYLEGYFLASSDICHYFFDSKTGFPLLPSRAVPYVVAALSFS